MRRSRRNSIRHPGFLVYLPGLADFLLVIGPAWQGEVADVFIDVGQGLAKYRLSRYIGPGRSLPAIVSTWIDPGGTRDR
ncbi:MAG: hypothetical protein R2864_15310 [Syntrophotaleaceae bacterium]